jgi:1-acyl-sn-glycerol-3-phosphate acyltransferase
MILRLFALWFRLKGWKTGEGIPSSTRKCVVIAAPHTSNWDYVYCMAAGYLLGVEIRYLAKKELFRFPLKRLLINTGGLPVIRDRNTRMVDSMIDLFNRSEQLRLIIPAEGTRKRVERWKSGFYHVAMGAGVPVHLGYLDYKNRIAGFGPAIQLTGNREEDARVIREFYRNIQGRYPEKFNLDAIRFDF